MGIKTFQQANDIVNAILFFLADGSDFVTGVALDVEAMRSRGRGAKERHSWPATIVDKNPKR